MKTIFKKTVLISVLTFCSRVLGVIRDAVIAMLFGTSAVTDAFFIAFRPFDLARKMFSEGILGVSFIPVFSRVLENKGRPAAMSMLFSFFCFLSAAAVIIIMSGLFFAPLVISTIAPGFAEGSYQYQLSVLLFKIMLPYIWLILIIALSMGVLNSFGNFGVPASAPLIFNLIVISMALFTANYFEVPVMVLAISISLGGLLQLILQAPFIIRLGLLKPAFIQLFNPETLKVVKIMLPAMIGAASHQINIMVASFFASNLDEGSVSFLYYADRLVQFPMALFAVSVATVFLPDLSKKAAAGKTEDIGPLFSNGVIMVLFVTIPAMAGLMSLNIPIVNFLFGRGAFDIHAVNQTAGCLFFLVGGLWAFTGSRLFVTLYYALSNIRTPFYSGMIAIVLNLCLCPVLIGFFELQGLVLSVAVSAVAGFLFLLYHLPGAVKIDIKRITVSACRSVFFSVIMFFLVKKIAVFVPMEASNAALNGAGLCGCICFGMFFYFGINYIISSPELNMLQQGLLKK